MEVGVSLRLLRVGDEVATLTSTRPGTRAGWGCKPSLLRPWGRTADGTGLRHCRSKVTSVADRGRRPRRWLAPRPLHGLRQDPACQNSQRGRHSRPRLSLVRGYQGHNAVRKSFIPPTSFKLARGVRRRFSGLVRAPPAGAGTAGLEWTKQCLRIGTWNPMPRIEQPFAAIGLAVLIWNAALAALAAPTMMPPVISAYY